MRKTQITIAALLGVAALVITPSAYAAGGRKDPRPTRCGATTASATTPTMR